VVKVGHHKESGESYAIKIVTKAAMEEFDHVCLREEIAILTDFPHEHIIRLYDVFDEPEHIHLVLEKVDGGQLLERIIEKENYTECEARDVGRIIFEAMRHCHEHKVAHRDLKPDNLLLTVRVCTLNYLVVQEPFLLHQLSLPTWLLLLFILE
jgi:calcium/calmodulin-dependent protein kinase I